MKAAIFRGPGVVEIGERPDPAIEAPTDAIVRVMLACVCGSDLWYFREESWRGGPAPARIYIPELLDDVLAGTINPGRVFDYETDLDHVADAYAAMDERRAIKSLIRAGSA